jgi:excisionase family DNA binding protein
LPKLTPQGQDHALRSRDPIRRVSVAAMARKRDDSDDGRRLLTVDQLADRWQVSPRTIRRMIKNGQIPVIRIGRSVRIHPRAAAR